jgi:hypothetical protein
VTHAPGERFRWNVGETLLLGAPSANAPQCALARRGDAR